MTTDKKNRIAPDEQERGCKPSADSGRATTPSSQQKAQKGLNRRSVEPRKCEVCHRSFIPINRSQKVCSGFCRDEKRRAIERERYQKSVADRPKKPHKSQSAKQPFSPKLTRRGQMKQVFNSAKEAIASLSETEVATVERIMNLPHSQRWNAGACDWTEAQRALARKIELHRISIDAKLFEEEESVRSRLVQVAQTDQRDVDDDDFADNDENS